MWPLLHVARLCVCVLGELCKNDERVDRDAVCMGANVLNLGFIRLPPCKRHFYRCDIAQY